MSETQPSPANAASSLTSSSESASTGLPSVILPSITSHRRLLPTPAAHAFSYPLVYLGVDVDDLESGRLNAGLGGLALRFGRPWTSLLSIQADNYLATRPFTDAENDLTVVGLRQGLLQLLWRFHSIDPSTVGRIWLLSMPSYVGKRAMNPLSVWFVYEKSEGKKLMAVVLEVHNTFGERHMYVLRAGFDELDASQVARGHHHAWHTHRNFHVSPFNDRGGYYRLDLCDPFHEGHEDMAPADIKFKVTLHLLTRDKKRKLFANLINHPSADRRPESITASSIARRIVWSQPMDLLLTTPRILIQAWSLHYRKGLRVYPRPEPETVEGDKDGSLTLPIVENAGQLPDEQEVEAGMSIGTWLGNALGWQETSASEARCRRLVVRYLEAKADEERITISISFGNRSIAQVEVRPNATATNSEEASEKQQQLAPSVPDSGYASAEDERSSPSPSTRSGPSSTSLHIRTRHPAFFTRLAMSPSPAHFLAEATGDRHTVVSSVKLFQRVFVGSKRVAATAGSSEPSRPSSLASWTQARIDGLRRTYLFWLLSFCVRPIPPTYVDAPAAAHFLQVRDLPGKQEQGTISTWEGVGLLYTLATVLFFDWLEERIMNMARARFVKGMEPWGTWKRAVDCLWKGGRGDEVSNEGKIPAEEEEVVHVGSVYDGTGVVEEAPAS